MRIEWQIVFWLTAFAFIGLLLWLFNGVIMPFAAAFIIAYLLDPLADYLQRLGLNRLSATLLILFSFVVVLVLILVLVVPILTHQFAAFIQALPGLLNKLQGLVSGAAGKLNSQYAEPLLRKLGFHGSGGIPDIRASMGDIAGQAAGWFASVLNSVVTHGAALISLVSLLVVTPVVAFYMLLDYHRMIAAVDGLIPPRYRGIVNQLAHQIDTTMSGFLRGQSLVCLFLGLWYGVGLSLVGLNFGLLIGITAGFLSFIPYVGSMTALVAAAIISLVQGWPHWSLFASAMVVVAVGQFLEGNVISPKLVGDSVGLHPVWLIFALLAFGSLLGFTGLIIAVPVAAAVGVIMRYAVQKYRQSHLYLSLPQANSIILSEATKAREER
jgi:predicted PurR-regulated permease PerM